MSARLLLPVAVIVFAHYSCFYPICSLCVLALLCLTADSTKSTSFRRATYIVVLIICLYGGQSGEQLYTFVPRSGNYVSYVLNGLFGAALQVTIIFESKRLTAWLDRPMSIVPRSKTAALLGQLVFPTLWLGCQEFLLGKEIGHCLGTGTGLYPVWMAGNRIDVFLDAVFGQCLASLSTTLLLACTIYGKNAKLSSKNSSTHYQSLRSQMIYSSQLSVCLGTLLVIGHVIFVSLTQHRATSLQIGCVRPTNREETSSVLKAVKEQFNNGGDIMLIPASSGYITEVPEFIQFKADISEITHGSSTVVVPTMNFANETACQARMHLQVYPLGEEKFINSYTNSVTRANGNVLRKSNHIGSTFLTWRSQRIAKTQGSLLVACAICLDMEFPDIFTSDNTPDLLLIPNSAWSAAVNSSRTESLKKFATTRHTAVLSCEDNVSMYIDPYGKVVTHTGSGNFFIDYDHVVHGRLIGLRIGLWWSLPLCGPLIIRILARLCSKSGGKMSEKSRLFELEQGKIQHELSRNIE